MRRSGCVEPLRFTEILYVELNKTHWDRAQEQCDAGSNYKGSHRGVSARQVGFLGEIVVRDYLDEAGVRYLPEFTTRHDLVIEKNGRCEIKTKDRTVVPKLEYDCSIPLYNHEHQDVSYWVFVSLLRSKSDSGENIERFRGAYIVGACNRDMLDSKSKVWEAGQTDPDNGTTFWTACRNIRIADLRDIGSASSAWVRQQGY